MKGLIFSKAYLVSRVIGCLVFYFGPSEMLLRRSSLKTTQFITGMFNLFWTKTTLQLSMYVLAYNTKRCYFINIYFLFYLFVVTRNDKTEFLIFIKGDDVTLYVKSSNIEISRIFNI